MRIGRFSGLLLVLFWQCSPDYLHLKVDELSENYWAQADIKTYQFEVSPKDKKLEMSFVLENNEDYPYNNIYLFTELKHPSGKTEKDTLQYHMTSNSGHFLGTGIGGNYTNLLLMKDSVNLPELGLYQIRVIHGMRVNKLKGVSQIGFRVLKKN